jgi:hypothetical protein
MSSTTSEKVWEDPTNLRGHISFLQIDKVMDYWNNVKSLATLKDPQEK